MYGWMWDRNDAAVWQNKWFGGSDYLVEVPEETKIILKSSACWHKHALHWRWSTSKLVELVQCFVYESGLLTCQMVSHHRHGIQPVAYCCLSICDIWETFIMESFADYHVTIYQRVQAFSLGRVEQNIEVLLKSLLLGSWEVLKKRRESIRFICQLCLLLAQL